MTGPQTLLGTAIRRVSACLAIFMVALMAAPVAMATPEEDADAAITQAWEAAGGAAGALGAKDGGVFVVGAGFGQNLSGGKIYFTPETGAHVMQGAILDKYLSLGGPADGDLGFPNIDEGDGKAPGSRNTTFSASDKPVIFWTPDNGARVVRGAINAAWDKLGGSGASLGVPVDDEKYDGNTVSQTFEGGRLSWDWKTKAFTTTPPELAEQLVGLAIPGDATSAINTARRAAGGPLGPLGAAEGAQYTVGADGVAQNFAGGRIFYTPATGANVVSGPILDKYESVGGPDGDLGLPTATEADGGLDQSRVVTFAAADQPLIFWTPDYGAVVVRGAMNAAWNKLGGATGPLGAPTSGQVQNGDVVTQTFAGGAISWDQATKKFSSEPPNLASSLSDLKVPGLDAPKSPSVAQSAPRADEAKWYTWHRSYLLGIIPVAMLIAAIAVAVFLNVRRRNRRLPAESDGEEDYYDDDYDDADYDGDGDGDDDDDDRGYRDDHSIGSGPGHVGAQGEYAPISTWAMPVELTRVDEEVDEDEPVAAPISEFAPDEDAVDTAPTPIESEVSQDSAPPVEPPAVHASGPPSGRHAAIQLDEPDPMLTSLRLAVESPYDAPTGYPVKADTKSGLYWTPDDNGYGVARAEIWFASEEFALTNGFVKG